MLMNAFGTIYHYNYQHMDEVPQSEIKLKRNLLGKDAEKATGYDGNHVHKDFLPPGLHFSTFHRQMAFEVLYFMEFFVLLGFGLSSNIVQYGFLPYLRMETYLTQTNNNNTVNTLPSNLTWSETNGKMDTLFQLMKWNYVLMLCYTYFVQI